jgi:DnaJ-class molecular chaperone
MNNRTHYDTLGVKQDASIAEIKKAFRELSLQTHPDVAKDKQQGERFKLIVEAYRVLSNTKERAMYDLHVEGGMRFGGFRGAGGAYQRPPPQAGQDGLHLVLDRVFHPRVVFLLLTFGVATVCVVRSYVRYNDQQDQIKKDQGGRAMVEAWKNPTTGQWELPAPWDPHYKKLQPTLQFVPREQVKQVQPPSR